MKALVLVLTLVVGATSGWAQSAPGPLTLDEAIATAKSNSPRLRQLQAAENSAGWEKLKALSGQIPHLTATATHLMSEQFQVLPFILNGVHMNFPEQFPYTDTSVKASWTVFDGFYTYDSFAAAKHEYSAAELELKREDFQVEENIRTKFYQALGAQMLAQVAEQNVQTLEQHLADIQRDIRGGISTNYDALRIEVQLEDSRAEKLEAEDNVEIAKIRLAQSMGLEKIDRSLAGQLPKLKPEIVNQVQIDTSKRDDLNAKSEVEAGAEKTSDAAHAFWWPQLSVYAEQDWYDFVDQGWSGNSTRNAYSLGVSLNWNLFDGGASLASERIAANQKLQASEEKRKLELQIPGDIEIWKRKYLHSIALYEAKMASIEKAQESVRLARIGVRAGTRTNTDYLDAEMDLIRSRAAAVRAQIDGIEALSQLELAAGYRL